MWVANKVHKMKRVHFVDGHSDEKKKWRFLCKFEGGYKCISRDFFNGVS